MKFTIRTLAVAAALVLSATPAAAGEYYVISDGDESIMLGEVGTAQRRGSTVKMWFTTLYSAAQDDDAWRRDTLVEFNCRDRRDRMLEMISRGRDGGLLRNTAEPGPWTSSSPDSVGAAMVRFACDRNRSDFQRVKGDHAMGDLAEAWCGDQPAVAAAPAAPSAPVVLQVPPAPAAATNSLFLLSADDDKVLLLDHGPGSTAKVPRLRVSQVYAKEADGAWIDELVYEYDCRTRRDRLVGSTRYGRDGKVLARERLQEPWEGSEPESLGAAMLAFACERVTKELEPLPAGATVADFAQRWWARPPASKAWGRGG